MPDNRLAAQNGRVGVDNHAILEGWMPLVTAYQVALSVGRKAQCAECHTLIELDVPTDFRRLANHDARAVIDEKVIADLRARMDVDAGAAVSPLGHHAGNERNIEVMQHVSQSVDRDRFQSRIAEDHLVE